MVRRRTQQPYEIEGVDALFGEPVASEPAGQRIAIGDITPSEKQPRRYFDDEAMNDLTESVKQHGILQPLLVRPKTGGGYELVAGERRYRAARAAKLEDVPVVIRELNDEEAFQLAILENLQREDLNPVEETESILQLVALRLKTNKDGVITLLNQAAHPDRSVGNNVIHSKEWQTVIQVFSAVGKFTPDSFRTNRLPLLNLPEDVLEVLRQGQLAYTKARAIARIKDIEQRQSLLQTAIDEDLSLTQIKERIAVIHAENKNSEKAAPTLKQQVDDAYRRIKQSKVWDDPKKKRKLEKLLVELNALADENI